MSICFENIWTLYSQCFKNDLKKKVIFQYVWGFIASTLVRTVPTALQKHVKN